ncbi:MAG: hypothetical protein ACE5DY_08345 [Mariprofundaceae bacterium]
MLEDFITSDFNQKQEVRFYRNGLLTAGAEESVMQRLSILAHAFSELLLENAGKPMLEKVPDTLMLSSRQWEHRIIAGQRRQD